MVTWRVGFGWISKAIQNLSVDIDELQIRNSRTFTSPWLKNPPRMKMYFLIEHGDFPMSS